MKKRFSFPVLTAAQKSILAFWISAVGIAGGLVFISPLHETAGTLVTMVCALLAGIFHTRHMKNKREEQSKK